MPYTIRKVRNKDCYKVVNKINDRIHAKCSTLENAKKQKRLLDAIDHGFKLGKSSKKRTKKRSVKKRSVKKRSVKKRSVKKRSVKKRSVKKHSKKRSKKRSVKT